MYFLAILFLPLTVLYALRFIFTRRPENLPPGPVRLPFIGNLHLLGKLPHRSVTQLAGFHGPVMSLRLGSVTTVVVSSVVAAREVLQKHDLAFSSRAVPDSFRAHDHSSYSVITLPAAAPAWRLILKVMNSNIFSGSRLNATSRLRHTKVQDLINYCRKRSHAGEAVDIGSVVFNTSLNLVFNVIFSKDLTDDSSMDRGSFRKMVRGIMVEAGATNLSDFFTVLRRFDPQRIRRRMCVHMGKALQVFRGLIDERLEMRKSRSPGPAEDVMDVLLELSRENPEEIDQAFIEHFCLDLFIGAADTTSSTVEWAMVEALRRPEILKKAKSEMERVVGKGEPIQESSFRCLPYLQSVVKETFRLHPPAPFLVPRMAEHAADLCGYTVPKGCHLWVNFWAIGRDPDVWANPLEFSPDRFLETAAAVDVWGTDFELIPFGAGRRICPGLPLGARMVPLVLGSLINSFDWRVAGGLDMAEKFGLTISKARALKVVPVVPV